MQGIVSDKKTADWTFYFTWGTQWLQNDSLLYQCCQ